MQSSLMLYERAFDRVLYLCITDEPRMQRDNESYQRTEFRHFPIHRKNNFSRFLESFPTNLPACIIHMKSRKLRRELIQVISVEIEKASKAWCIVENLAPSQFIPCLQNAFSDLTVVYRSHDVSELAFLPFAQKGSLISRAAWQWEIFRIHNLEARTLRHADRFWTITQRDSEVFARLHDRASCGVLGVQIDIERYIGVAAGASNRLLYLGSSDIRKAKGLWRFIKECWPLVREMNSEMEFWVGGPGTEQFADPELGISAFGSVHDECEFLGHGRALINPQDAGTGIKLKSLVAMASGKLLISSENGVMGVIGGESGHHYIVSRDPEQMARDIAILWSDPERAAKIASAGQSLVRLHYDIGNYSKNDAHLAQLLGRV